MVNQNLFTRKTGTLPASLSNGGGESDEPDGLCPVSFHPRGKYRPCDLGVRLSTYLPRLR